MVEKDKTTIIAIFLFSISGLLSSFFFSGGTNISYAPAIIFTVIALFLSWDKPVKIPLHTLLLFAFIIFSGLSFFWSSAPYISLVSWIIISILPISYLLIRFVLQRFPDNSPRIITYILILLGSVFCLYGFSDFLKVPSWRLHSIFANPNTFSALIVLCLIPSIVLTTRVDNKLLWSSISLLLLASLILTGSRSGLLTIITAISLIFLLSPIKHKAKYITLLIASYTIIGALFYLLEFTFFTRIIQTFSESYSSSIQGRITIWAGALDLAKDNLIYGTGLGTFFLEYPPYRLPYDPSVGDWAHNDTLQILTEIGAIGVTLWLSFWCTLLYSLLKNYKHISHYALIGAICSIAFFIQGNITYLYLVMPVLFIIGGCLALYDNELKNTKLSLKKYTWAIPSIFIMLITAQSAFSMFTAQIAQKNMIYAQKETAIKQIELIDKFGSPYFYEHYLILGRRGDLNALEKAKTACSTCPDPYFIQGLIYDQNGDQKLAKSALWKAMIKDPSNQNIRFHFVKILEIQKRYKEALIIAQAGFNYPIESKYSHYFKEIILKTEENQ